MPRIRTIKPEFFDDAKLSECPIQARFLFIALWVFADDEGIVRGDVRWLKSKIFPYDEDLRVGSIEQWMLSLSKARLLIPFTFKGESYYMIRTFKKHQRIDKPYPSLIPMEIIENLSFDERSTNVRISFDERSRLEKEKEIELEEEERRRKEAENPPVPPPEIPKVVKPKKVITLFVPPTIEESENFFVEKMQSKWSVEFAVHQGRSFYNYFTSNGWLVSGKSPMKDWRAAASNWMGRTTKSEEIKFLNGGNDVQNGSRNYSGTPKRGGTIDELSAIDREWQLEAERASTKTLQLAENNGN